MLTYIVNRGGRPATFSVEREKANSSPYCPALLRLKYSPA